MMTISTNDAPTEQNRELTPTETDQHDKRFRRALDLWKTILTFAGAALAFFMLTRPDAVLNQAVSRENVRRERAKLLIEALREDDQAVRMLALDALESSYKEDDDQKWLDRARSAFAIREKYTRTSAQLSAIFQQRTAVEQRTDSQQSSEYRALQEQSKRTTAELEVLRRELKRLHIEPPRLQEGGAMGCVTLDVFNVTSGSALLMGAAAGSKTREWFDFGSVPEMGYSVDAVNGVGTARPLQPKTTYYFRYVLQNGNTTCLGDVQSFTTAG
jgi:hypothetical protein